MTTKEALLTELNRVLHEMDTTPLSLFPGSDALKLGRYFTQLKEALQQQGVRLGTNEFGDFYDATREDKDDA